MHFSYYEGLGSSVHIYYQNIGKSLLSVAMVSRKQSRVGSLFSTVHKTTIHKYCSCLDNAPFQEPGLTDCS